MHQGLLNACKAAAAILVLSANHLNLATKVISFLTYFSIRLDKSMLTFVGNKAKILSNGTQLA